jgi:hypothetical protein
MVNCFCIAINFCAYSKFRFRLFGSLWGAEEVTKGISNSGVLLHLKFIGAKRIVNLKPFLSEGNYSFRGFIVIEVSAKQGFGPRCKGFSGELSFLK